jgi:hypothetical protein
MSTRCSPATGLRRLAIVALACFGLAGCYNVDATVTFGADGDATVTGRLDFPRDAVHVANLYRAVLELRPETSKFVNDGLCQGAEKLAALNPTQPVPLRAREYTTETRFGCGFLYEAGDSAALVEKLVQVPGGAGNVFKTEPVGPRRVRFEIDFNNMPDLSQALPGLIMLGAMQYGGPGNGMPNMAAIDKITKAYAEAALAMARMSASGNHIQYAIKARRVIETNGKQEGNLVRFRWSWEDFIRLMIKPTAGAPESKIYYAVIEY